ncbi:MAG: hypothetical protein WC071_06710 [Victivallaceae bacterium]
MPENKSGNNRLQFIALAIICCVAVYFIQDAIFRDLWFDEALTIINFMQLPNPLAIYRNYVIPNNQIVYTILLKGWDCLYPQSMSVELFWRLFSVVTGLSVLTLMLMLWQKKCGLTAIFPVATAFAASIPFMIYATGLRGYMLSMVWIVLAMYCAGSWTFRPNWRNASGYFIFSLLAVGTIPSNLLASAGIAIFLFPYFGFKKVFSAKFIYLALTPLAAIALFYLPILKQTLKVINLGEGVPSSELALKMTYAGFVIPMLPVLIPAILGWFVFLSRKSKRKFLWLAIILLIPIPVIITRNPAPFPRVFLCLWPLWLMLTGLGLFHFMAYLKSHFKISLKNLRIISLLLAVAAFGWGIAQRQFNAELSSKLAGGNGLDDYFYPYYMQPDYQPYNLMKKIYAEADGRPADLYFSFNAAPPAIIFYGVLLGFRQDGLLYDPPPPRKKLEDIPDGTLVILSSQENPDGIKQRFHLKNLQPLFKQGYHEVFKAEK